MSNPPAASPASSSTGSPAGASSPASPAKASPPTDAVTAAQRALDDLAVLMFTYVGVVQRDAPPASRAPDDQEEVAGDEAARSELAARAPEYAAEVLRGGEAVRRAVERVALEVEGGREREEMLRAEKESVCAGEGMAEEVGKVESLLERVREVICKTEQDVV